MNCDFSTLHDLINLGLKVSEPATPMHPPPPSEASPTSPPSVASSANPIARATHTPTFYTNLCGVAFEAALGDLTEEQTDALVNSTDEELQLGGNMSKAIV